MILFYFTFYYSFEFNVTMLTLNCVCVVFGVAYFCSIVLYIIEKRRHNQDKYMLEFTNNY